MPATSFFFADLARRNEQQQLEYRQRQLQIQRQLLLRQRTPRRQVGGDDEDDADDGEDDGDVRSVSTEAAAASGDDLSTQAAVGWGAALARTSGGEHYLY